MRTKAEKLANVERYLQSNVEELMQLDGPECDLTAVLELVSDAILTIRYRRKQLARKARKTGEVQYAD